MAERVPVDKKDHFEIAVYELGLKLIEDYRAGNCRDSNKVLEAIIELFKVSQGKTKLSFNGGQ